MDIVEESAPDAPFRYVAFDARPHLPTAWYHHLLVAALDAASPIWLRPRHSSSREPRSMEALPGWHVAPAALERAPWLLELYRGPFYEAAQSFTDRPLVTSSAPYAVAINLAETGQRSEVHLDTNGIQAVLGVTEHQEGHGGELAVAHRQNAVGLNAVLADCTIIRPRSGRLYVFDGHQPHCACATTDRWRATVDCNYYYETGPGSEGDRPDDLSIHLRGVPRLT
jgi:hypothetical protein